MLRRPSTSETPMKRWQPLEPDDLGHMETLSFWVFNECQVLDFGLFDSSCRGL